MAAKSHRWWWWWCFRWRWRHRLLQAEPPVVQLAIVVVPVVGVVPAIGYIAIGRAFDVDHRPRMFAILSTAWVVPGLLGPVLAERVAGAIGWRL